MIRLGLLTALLFATCPPRPPVPPPGAATCADVCKNLEKLGCEAARPTAEGTPCAVVCQNVQDSGVIRWNLECRVNAASCQAVDQCER